MLVSDVQQNDSDKDTDIPFQILFPLRLLQNPKHSSLCYQGVSDRSAGKESACSVGDLGSIPGLGRSPEEGKSYPLQYSGLENSMDCTVHGVAKSQTGLSDLHFPFPCALRHILVGYLFYIW